MAFLPIAEDPYFKSRPKVFSSANIQSDDSVATSFNFAASGAGTIKVPNSVQYVKVPNLVMSTSGLPPSMLQPKMQNVNVKQEPESPSHKSSITNIQNIQFDTGYPQDACNNLMTVETNEIDDQEKFNKLKKLEEESSDTENKAFILAPTPAQLGKAPLQRRQNIGKIMRLRLMLLLTIRITKQVILEATRLTVPHRPIPMQKITQ